MSNIATFEQIDQSPMTRRQYSILAAAILADMLEFFDFFMLGFILSFIVGPWELTYYQTAFLVLTSGVGAIVGGFLWGYIADRIGRRKVFIATVLNFSLFTGALALVPEGSWFLLGLLRFFVGLGVGGLYSVDLPLVQEFVPSSKRGLMGGLVGLCIPLGGIVLGSALAAFLGPAIGWRGLVLIGTLPALLSLYIRTSVPESPRWLINNGHRDEARQAIGWALEIPPEDVKVPEEVPTVRTSWRELFRYPRSLAVSWLGNLGMQTATYGIVLWGPTLLVLVLGVSPVQAAFMFIFVGLSAFVGRIVFAVVSELIGRRLTGGLVGFGAALFLTLAGVLPYDATLAGLSVFYLMIVAAYFFTDGGFALVGPYAAEVWPTNLRTTGMGSAYGFGGLGKIIGPAGLALIAGSTNVVNPGASIDALTPGFIFLACFGVLAGLAYLVLGIETQGKSIEEIDGELRVKGKQLIPS
jgi:MFS transporter, putative metabolite:H+ symporter